MARIQSTNAVVANALNASRLSGPNEVVTLVPPEQRINACGATRNATGYVKIASELDLIEAACIKAERAMELEGARISLKPIMDAYRKVRAQVADWWEDKKRRGAL